MLQHPDRFANRHLGPAAADVAVMLKPLRVETLDQLIDQTLPAHIRLQKDLPHREALSEAVYLRQLREIAAQNQVFQTYIGLGYYDCVTPSVILRNIFENPGWYTQYTPYQAEIAQGRLEALLNFQTMISDLTALPIANASLLDEGTAAAEAMSMTWGQKNKRARGAGANVLLVASTCFPQTIDVLRTRAAGLGIELRIADPAAFEITEDVFAAIVQYPDADGALADYSGLAEKLHAQESYLIAAADLLSLALLKAPGEWGADVVVGSAQRFGVPMGYGGPHAAFFATKEEFLRLLPGRIIGVSIDAQENPALRMTLQTREQHIRRDKATSNICTAQALLAIMAGMYAVYHGPEGVRAIARRVHGLTFALDKGLQKLGYRQVNESYFDTLSLQLESPDQVQHLRSLALANRINLRYEGLKVGISLDETTEPGDVMALMGVFAQAKGSAVNGFAPEVYLTQDQHAIAPDFARTSEFLTHPVFNTYHSETAMMRYIKRLENKDLSLNTAMIPLGSCTMKLNAATELIPVSWPEFAKLHPFVPKEQAKGYLHLIEELGEHLCEITGFAGISLQPNSGAQGEYAGLMVIRAYHQDRGDFHRDVALVPSSAHGTNPASAVMAGMKVVVVRCDEMGNIDVDDRTAQQKPVLPHDHLSLHPRGI